MIRQDERDEAEVAEEAITQEMPSVEEAEEIDIADESAEIEAEQEEERETEAGDEPTQEPIP